MDFSTADIRFSIVFKFSVVCIDIFGNRQIKLKNAQLPQKTILRDRIWLLKSVWDIFIPYFCTYHRNFPNIFLKTFLELLLQERSLVTVVIFSFFPPHESHLKFKIFLLKLLITLNQIAVENFCSQIWNQITLKATIHKMELTPSTHPFTQPPIRTIQVFEVSKKVHPHSC